MNEIVTYLKENYYPRYSQIKPEQIPDDNTLLKALNLHKDKTIVVTKDGRICGVAVYLTLDDRTFEHIRSFDLNRLDVLTRLLEQNGQNFHFILLTANSMKAIRIGLRFAMSLKPRTISWWNPTMTYLHRIFLTQEN